MAISFGYVPSGGVLAKTSPNYGVPVGGANPVAAQYNNYSQGVQQNASDYNYLTDTYKNLLNKFQSQPTLTAPTYNPSTYAYTPTSDYKSAYGQLSGLSQTGGYSASDIADLRARGIDPVRAVYAQAQQNIDRQRALQGGYSPNYTAASAKLARDMAQQVSDAEQNVNAGIADKIASNKLSATNSLANLAAQESEAENAAGERNTDITNQGKQFNIQMPLEYNQANNANNDNILNTLSGYRSLYGTTPALSATFGGQALDAAQFQNQMNNQNVQNQLQIISQLLGH